MRVKCRAREHNTMSPARAQTLTTPSVGEQSKHEATVLPQATDGGAGSEISHLTSVR